MPTSEAKIRSNQANAARSTGPRTERGKTISSANSLKHGMTGEGIVMLAEDLVEVENRREEFQSDLKPITKMGRILIDRMAIHSVRMDRCVAHETAALSVRLLQAEADFVTPDGLDKATVDQLRDEAGRRAMFDPSKEACLGRKYEASAERGFFRALKEFRQIEKAARAPVVAFEKVVKAPVDVFADKPTKTPVVSAPRPVLGSFLPAESMKSMLDSLPSTQPPKPVSNPRKAMEREWETPLNAAFQVPIAIGRAR